MKGQGLGQLQHSMNNLFLESATMPPNVKDILRYPSSYRSRFHICENSKKIQTKMRSRSAFQKRKRCDFGFTGAAKPLQIQDILKCLN